MPVDSLVQPSIMRYRRVQAVLSGEPAFAAVQSDASFEVKNRAGEDSAYFSPEVAAVTHNICIDGRDPLNVTKFSIVEQARKLIANSTPGKVTVPKVSVKAATAVKKAQRKPKTPAPKAVAKKTAPKRAVPTAPPKEAKTVAATPITEFSRDHVFDFRVGMTSLLCSAHELAHNYDTSADKKDKLSRLEKIIADYEPVRSQDAQETSKTD